MIDQPIRCFLCGVAAEERHHVAGKRIDPRLIVDLCKACHRRVQVDLEEFGVQLDRRHRTMLEQLVSFLRGLAAFFLELSKRLVDWADLLAWLLGGGSGPAPETVS